MSACAHSPTRPKWPDAQTKPAPPPPAGRSYECYFDWFGGAFDLHPPGCENLTEQHEAKAILEVHEGKVHDQALGTWAAATYPDLPNPKVRWATTTFRQDGPKRESPGLSVYRECYL